MVVLFLSALGALFSVVNPLGAVPVFLAMSSGYSKYEIRKTVAQTSLYFFLILTAFFFAGTGILHFFGISLDAMRIAGGMVILASGYSLLEGKFKEGRAINKKVEKEAIEKDDISFTPLAMPLLSGPGSISLLIGMYSENPIWVDKMTILGSIAFMAGIVYLILLISPQLYKILGESGLKAISRIMGFMVMAIGVQYIIAGMVNLVRMTWGV